MLPTMFWRMLGSHLRGQALLPMLLGVAVASGQFIFIVPIGLLCLVQFPPHRFIKTSATFCFLVGFCLIFFAAFKRPVSLDYGYLTPQWVFGLALSLLIVFTFGYAAKSFQEAELRLFWIGLVAFCYGALSIVATVLWMDPPYYGRVFDVVHWGGFGSGSRVSDLMLLTPIFLCGILVSCNKTDSFFYFVVMLSLISIFLNLFLEKRIFFIMVFLVLPILFLLFNGCIKFSKISINFVVLCFAFLGAYALYGQFFEKFSLEYSRNGGRLWLYESFFQQMVSSDAAQVVLPRSLTDSPLWFHNIFMDVYRISGPWAALSLIGLFLAFASRLLALSRAQPVSSRVITCWFIPLFIISNVSVVPEGEPQFLLLMVFLMGVTERMLHQADFGNARSV